MNPNLFSNEMEKNNKKNINATYLAMKAALNCAFKGINIESVQILMDKLTEFDNKILDFLTNVRSNEDLQIVESFINQGLCLINELEKKGE